MVGQTITRADLTDAVYQEVGLSRNESADLVDSVLGEIAGALVQGDVVKISSATGLGVSGLQRPEIPHQQGRVGRHRRITPAAGGAQHGKR
jgi:nucleoid DNA-binding protein